MRKTERKLAENVSIYFARMRLPCLPARCIQMQVAFQSKSFHCF